MALADILGALIGSQAGATAPGVDPGQSVGTSSQGSTPLSELLVQGGGKPKAGPAVQMAPPPSQPTTASQNLPTNIDPGSGDQSPQSVGLNYNNSPSVAALNAQDQANMPTQVNSGNPGLYGILPKSLQHGVLRNTLGAIGDAFLVGGGKQPTYADALGREAVGNAMAGVNYDDPNSVAAAMQRVGATGAPGSTQDADAMQKNYNDVRLRQAQMESLNQYRQSTEDNRTDMRLQQIVPTLGGVLANVKDSASYDQAYDQIQKRIQRIDPNSTPEMLGLPARGTWTQGSTAGYGTTGGQQLTSATSTNNNVRSTQQSGVNAQTAAGARVQSARIMAGSHSTPLDNQLFGQWQAAAASGQPLAGPLADAIDKRFGTPTNPHPSQSGVVHSPYANQPTPTGPGAAVGNSAGAALGGAMAPRGGAGRQTFQNGQIYHDANGNRARYVNGKFVPA
jgi:hypothetical protein